MNLIRKLAHIFPYPARMSGWTYESPNFLSQVWELQNYWQLESDFKQFEQEIQEKLSKKNGVELEILLGEAKNIIKDFERRLVLLFALSLWGLIWLLSTILTPAKINIFSSSATWLSFYNLLCAIGIVLSIISVVRFFNRAYREIFSQNVNLFYIDRELKRRI